MLLSPDTNDDDMVEIFGANNLDDYYTALKDKYFTREITFDTTFYVEIKEIIDVSWQMKRKKRRKKEEILTGFFHIQQLKEGDKKMNRTKAHIRLANMMDRADGHNIQILKILINW